MKRDDPAYPGQREYTPLFLRIYDPLILGFFTSVVWRCPTNRLLDGYRRHLGHRHLDVGPGTGYFLDRAGIPDGSPVTLLDPNVHVLDHASRRLRSTGRSTPQHSTACSIACRDRSRARQLPSPTWRPSSLRRGSSSVPRSSGPPGGIPGWRGAFSKPTTGAAPSTTPATRRKASAGSSRHRSSGWSWRRSGRWPSSRPRIRARSLPRHLHDEDELVRKAVGWALRNAGDHDLERLQWFL